MESLDLQDLDAPWTHEPVLPKSFISNASVFRFMGSLHGLSTAHSQPLGQRDRRELCLLVATRRRFQESLEFAPQLLRLERLGEEVRRALAGAPFHRILFAEAAHEQHGSLRTNAADFSQGFLATQTR